MSWEEKFTDIRAELRACQREVDALADEQTQGLEGPALNTKRAKARNNLTKAGQAIQQLTAAAKHCSDPVQKSSMERRLRQVREQRQAMLDKIGETKEEGIFSRLKGALGVERREQQDAEEERMFDDQDDEQLLLMQNETIDEQDAALSRLHNVIVRQKEVGIAIGNELDEQAPIVDHLARNVQRNKATLKQETRRVNQILAASSDSRLTYCIFLLLFAFFVVIVLALT